MGGGEKLSTVALSASMGAFLVTTIECERVLAEPWLRVKEEGLRVSLFLT